MNIIIGSAIIFFIFLSIAKPVHAIIILPAILLIPIAKIVALIMGGLSLPILSLGALCNKLFGTSLRKTIVGSIILLIFIGIAAAFLLKFFNPERPVF